MSRQTSHKIIQQHLLNALGPCAVMEKSYPSIGRIADIVHLQWNIVFEIQCSPISLSEVRARERSYLQLGLTVVWLMHDNLFNRRRQTLSERAMRSGTGYFVSISAGCVTFYDQLEEIQGYLRGRKSAPCRINICERLFSPRGKLYFEGDCTDLKAEDIHFSLPKRRSFSAYIDRSLMSFIERFIA